MIKHLISSAVAIVFAVLVFSYVTQDNRLALAAIAAIAMVVIVVTPLRVMTIPIIFLLDEIVFTFGYGSNRLFGARIGFADVLIVVSAVYYLTANLVQYHRDRIVVPNMLSWLALIVLGCVNLMMFNTYSEQSILFLQMFIIEPFLVIFIAMYTLRSRRDIVIAVASMGLIMLISNIWYVDRLYEVTGNLLPTGVIDLLDLANAMPDLYSNKNIYGAINVIFAILGIYFYRSQHSRIKKLVFLIPTFVCLYAILLSLSRGVYASLLLALVLVALLSGGRVVGNLISIVAVSAALFAVSVATGLLEVMANRFAAGDLNRIELLHQVSTIIGNYPIFGVGMHEAYYQDAMRDLGIISISGVYAHPHNSYLQAAAFFGLPGMILLVSILANICILLFRTPAEGSDRYLRTGFLTAVIAMLVDSSTDFILFNMYSSHAFWITAAVALAWVSSKNRELGLHPTEPLSRTQAKGVQQTSDESAQPGEIEARLL